jgi:hypothetical protein
MVVDAARRSRRSLLTGAAGAAVATTAAAIAAPLTALAAGSDGSAIRVGDQYSDVRTPTLLENRTNNNTVFLAFSDGSGTAIIGSSGADIGVYGTSLSAEGVYGFSSTGTGVTGSSDSGDGVFGKSTGIAIHGLAKPASGTPIGVFGETHADNAVAVLGNNYAKSGLAQGVQGTSDSPVGYATTGWARTTGTGVIGVSSPVFPKASVPASTGVYGYAYQGRGVVAAGTKAQLRLVPSSATTHPARGAAGDFFMDKSHRLWVCLGGTTWKRVQLV